MKILIIDDNADFLEVLETYLTWQHHDVVKAVDGQQGLQRFLQTPDSFDLILSDFSMPVMDGLEFLQEVRQQRFSVPVIFISASYDLDLYRKAAALNLYHWLRKPFDFEDLDQLLFQLANSTKMAARLPQFPVDASQSRGHLPLLPAHTRSPSLTLAAITM